MADTLDVDEYRDLLSSALPGAQDANTVEPSLTTLFTPDGHRAALHVDSTVVQGGRGVGKTFWYSSLLDDQLRSVAAQEYRIERLRSVHVATGYGAAVKPDAYPGPAELRSLMNSVVNPYDLWNAVLLVALGQPALKSLPRWSDRVDWVRSHPGERDRTIAQADQLAQDSGITNLVLFDALEHLHRDRGQANRLVAGILQLALEMRLGTRTIRFKVFIRPDMFDGALTNFPDGSKLISNAANLQWSRTNLYGLFFHHLGNYGGPSGALFRATVGPWTEQTEGRHQLPQALRGDEKVQAELFSHVAGPYMGANFRKGITYTWLTNHLMDGVEQVSPRSFLHALVKAADETRNSYAAHEYPLHHEGIRRGVQSASRIRVAELGEDMPWVQTAISPLGGQQVPIEPDLVVRLWDETDLTTRLRREVDRAATVSLDEDRVRTGPQYADDYRQLIEELITLGVMRRRKDDRIDLPDVYRIAFSIGRKGGVPMVTS